MGRVISGIKLFKEKGIYTRKSVEDSFNYTIKGNQAANEFSTMNAPATTN